MKKVRGSEAEGGWRPVLSGIFGDVFEGVFRV